MIGNIACFNELSEHPLCKTEEEAERRILYFARLLKAVRSHTGITKVRHANDISKIYLTKDMTMQDYCNKHMQEPAVAALIWTIIHPQVDMDDDKTLQSYFDTTTAVVFSEDKKLASDGFNAAYCQQTFCVGFNSHPVWDNDFFDISVTSNRQEKMLKWACISSLDFYSTDPAFANRKIDFDNWLKNIRPVELVKTKIPPDEKTIKLGPDHGKKELEEHAKLLFQSPYVEAVLTSLPYHPKVKSYISRIYDDGLIDITLTTDDRGLSMRLKTTGRNIAETREIAKIIKEKYGYR